MDAHCVATPNTGNLNKMRSIIALVAELLVAMICV